MNAQQNYRSREQLAFFITKVRFALIDISLFLDTHPEDSEALAQYHKLNKMYNDAMEEYARAYGPLMQRDTASCDERWKWVDQPWPWEGGCK